MRFRALISLFATLATLAAAPAPVAAAAPLPGVVHVGAVSEYFLPSIVSLHRGGTVIWDFTETHTATDATPMHLYDSHEIANQSFSYRFVAAGTYPFVCTIHTGMNGVVHVPISAAPARGAPHRSFTVTWSSAPAAMGFVFDVQRRRNDGPWTTWQDGTSSRSGTFVPWRKGTYRFRSRLRADGATAASGWSAAAAVVAS